MKTKFQEQQEQIELLPCPFCGVKPEPYDGDFRIKHKNGCYLAQNHYNGLQRNQ